MRGAGIWSRILSKIRACPISAKKLTQLRPAFGQLKTHHQHELPLLQVPLVFTMFRDASVGVGVEDMALSSGLLEISGCPTRP